MAGATAAIVVVGTVAYAAASGGSGSRSGSTGGRSRAAAESVLESAIAESQAATSVVFRLATRYEFTTSDGNVSGGSDLTGESDLARERSHATYTPVGFDAEILQSLASLGGSDFGDLAQGIEVIVADGSTYTRTGGGAWTSQLNDVVGDTASDPTQIVDILGRCQPVSVSAAPGGGSQVECSIPTDPETLAALGADLAGTDAQDLADANLRLDLSFATTGSGLLDTVTTKASGSTPDGSFTVDTTIELDEWNQPVSIEAPTS